MSGEDGAAGWSRDALRELCDGARVLARDAQARSVEAPAWIAEDLAPLGAWGSEVAVIHPNDRAGTVAAWWEAVATPGTPIVRRCRSSRDGVAWRELDITYLNLLEHEEVGAVIILHRDRGPAEVPAEPFADPGSRAAYAAPVWIVQHLDPVGAVIRTDGHVDEVFGVPAGDLVGRNVLEVLHPADHDAAIAMWLEVVAAPGETRTIHQRIVRPDGSSTWLESTVMNQLEERGAVVAVSHDVSARREQEDALRAREQELRTLAESVPVAVFRATTDGTVTYANALWYEVTATFGPVSTVHELAGGRPREAAQLAERWEALVAGAPCSADLDVAADGRTLRLRCRSLAPGGGGVIVLGTLDDVSADVALTAELRLRAERDDLTGLANRSGLQRKVEDVLAGDASDHVLVFVDLDGFKAVNDTWGHDAGDAVLRRVAVRLRAAVRPGDVVARYGGDEFVLLCAGVAAGDEDQIVTRIGDALQDRIVIGGADWLPAASVGVVRPRPGEPLTSALRRADAEMYQRKRDGGDRRGS